jgi:hypothetical protein
MGHMKDILMELAYINDTIDAFSKMGTSRTHTLSLMNGLHNTAYELCSRCELHAGITYDEQTLCPKCEFLAEGLALAQLDAIRDEN